MAVPRTGVDWPTPDALLDWVGENNISRDTRTNTVVAIKADAFEEYYGNWYKFHSATVAKLNEMAENLVATTNQNTVLGKEVEDLKEELKKSQQRSDAWAERYDNLMKLSSTFTGTGDTMSTPHNTIVHKIKPREPKTYDGAQDLEVVTRFLDEVEHYVRQGASMCPRATLDNQHIDTVWRFLSVKIFRWFEAEMKKHAIMTIPPPQQEYGVTWIEFKKVFKEQFVPEVAVSVVRKEWHALRFSRDHVLQFNRRALELVEILGGSLTITRADPLWEEYLRKLPEAAANDVTQQARLMRRVHKIDLTFSDMLEIVAERILPHLPASASVGYTGNDKPTHATSTTTNAPYDPMDLSNTEEHLNMIDETTKCYRCGGTGHVARQCPSPNPSNRQTPYKSRQPQPPGGKGSGSVPYNHRPSSQQPARQQQVGQQQQRTWHRETGQPRQSNWRIPDKKLGRQQLNTVTDDPEPQAGTYYEGGWADGCGNLGEENGVEDLVETVESDCEHCGGSGRGEGKDKQ